MRALPNSARTFLRLRIELGLDEHDKQREQNE
jgi:hypothetical protein